MDNYLKIPPHDDEAEKALIGSIMMDSIESIDKCNKYKINNESFYSLRHQILFAVIVKMNNSGKAIDALTIANELKMSGEIEKVGGFEYLSSVTEKAVAVGHVSHYCQIIIKHSHARRGIFELGSAIDDLFQSPDEPISVIESLAIKLDEIIPSKEDDLSAVDSIMAECEKAFSGAIINIPTPFDSVNMKTGGLRRGLVHVFCGRAKAGKSFFKALWLNYLGEKGIPALDFCFEDRKMITMCRRAGQLGNYNAMRVINGGSMVYAGSDKYEWRKISRQELEKHKHWLNEIDKMPIYHFDKRCGLDQLHSTASYYTRKYGIQAMFIDGVKDINRPPSKYNDTGYDEAISQATVGIAAAFDLAVIPIYHLTKLDDDVLITAKNIRGSGNIVSDARSIWALQSRGLESEAAQDGKIINISNDGRQTTRRFDCLENNFGEECVKWLDTDLGRSQFMEV